MRIGLFMLLILGFCSNAFAQTWVSSFASGVNQSEKSQQPMLVLLSYKVDNKLKGMGVFNSKEFKAYAKDNLVCVKIEMRYNYKTSSYEPKSPSNDKAISLFGNPYQALWLYDPKTENKQRIGITSTSGTTGESLVSAAKSFAVRMKDD